MYRRTLSARKCADGAAADCAVNLSAKI